MLRSEPPLNKPGPRNNTFQNSNSILMKEMTVKELKQKIDNNEDIEIIDVREPYEADLATLGAKLIPMGDVEDRVDEIPKNKPVVVHCRSGKRSASVIELLAAMHGFDNLYNLKGGILDWSKEIDSSIPTY